MAARRQVPINEGKFKIDHWLEFPKTIVLKKIDDTLSFWEVCRSQNCNCFYHAIIDGRNYTWKSPYSLESNNISSTKTYWHCSACLEKYINNIPQRFSVFYGPNNPVCKACYDSLKGK